MKLLRPILQRLAVAAVAVLVPLLVLEAALRAAGGANRGKAPYRRDRSPAVYYPEEGRLHPWSGRGEKPLRIAVVGDSVSEGWGVGPDDSYGFRLERLLNLNDGQRPAEVAVWAKGGYATFMEVPFVVSALRWGADVVVLGICLNDTEDARDADRLHRWRLEAMPRVPPPWLARVLRSSLACEWIYQKAEDLRAQAGYRRYYERIYSPTYSGWELFAKSIRKIRGICEKHGATLVAVVFPPLGGEIRPPFPAILQQIRNLLESEQVRCLDLQKDFEGLDPNRLQVVPYIDAHPNEIAHRIIARALFEYLLANGLIDRGYEPRSKKDSHQDFWEHLERRMERPLWEPLPATGEVEAASADGLPSAR